MLASVRLSLCRASLPLPTRIFFKLYSSQQEKPAEKRYTDTILLPKTNFQARINGKKRIEMDKYLQDVINF